MRTADWYRAILEEINRQEYNGLLTIPDVFFAKRLVGTKIMAAVEWGMETSNFIPVVKQVILHKAPLAKLTPNEAVAVMRHEAAHLFFFQVLKLPHSDTDLAWIAFCHQKGLIHNFCI
jgi:hypothetical protein